LWTIWIRSSPFGQKVFRLLFRAGRQPETFLAAFFTIVSNIFRSAAARLLDLRREIQRQAGAAQVCGEIKHIAAAGTGQIMLRQLAGGGVNHGKRQQCAQRQRAFFGQPGFGQQPELGEKQRGVDEFVEMGKRCFQAAVVDLAAMAA